MCRPLNPENSQSLSKLVLRSRDAFPWSLVSRSRKHIFCHLFRARHHSTPTLISPPCPPHRIFLWLFLRGEGSGDAGLQKQGQKIQMRRREEAETRNTRDQTETWTRIPRLVSFLLSVSIIPCCSLSSNKDHLHMFSGRLFPSSSSQKY